MKRIVIFWLTLVLLAGGVGVTGSVLAAKAADDAGEKAAQARAVLENRVNEVLAIIQDEVLAADVEKQEKTLYDKGIEIFDFNTFSRLALGRKYKEFSLDQRSEFSTWFSKLISKTYFPKLAGQDVSDIQVVYQKVHPLTPKNGIYRTDITTELVQGETHVAIVYRMIQKKTQEWKIYDIKIEDVSMAANYRKQYQQDLSLTPEQIIAHLKEKVEK